MDCEEVSGFLTEFHGGDASLKDDREALAHIKECEECRSSLQKILYDLDQAAYTAFFEEMEPPRGAVDKVLASLPGSGRKPAGRRKTAGRRKEPSSSRLAPARGERKKAGRRGRPGATGGQKAIRKTTTLRRRDSLKDQSGLFLQDQIFGSSEKKVGLIITYCEECGERIDPADFESGAAIHHQNASYCNKCKTSVVGEEEPKKSPARAAAPRKGARTKSRPAQKPATSKPASGRMATASPKKGMNLPLVGGGIMGAAALILIAVVVIVGVGGNSEEDYRRPPSNSSSGDEGEETEAKTEEVKKDKQDKATAKDEEKFFEEVEKDKQRMAEEAARVERLPLEKVNAWRSEAEKRIEKEGFDSAINFWNSIYGNATEGKIYDPKDMKEKPVPPKLEGAKRAEWIKKNWRVVKFTDEHLTTVQSELRRLRERRAKWAFQQLQQLEEEIMALVHAEKWDEAKKKAEDIPEGWDVKFPENVQKLRSIRDDIDMWERNWKKKKASELREKAARGVEAGAWVDLVKGKDDFTANWSRNGKVELEDDRGKWTITLRDSGSHIWSTFKNMTKWFDYEVEFEVKASARFDLGVRIHPQKRKFNGGSVPAVPQWKKIGVKVEGVTIEFTLDGKSAGSQPCEIQTGGLYIRLREAGYLKIRNLKIKINKLQ
ncbi:MAG: anti-sigma factor family protein [Planctomycetota bacterium]|jgi:hypothetical protein